MTILYQNEIIKSIDSAVALVCQDIGNIHEMTLDIAKDVISRSHADDNLVQRLATGIRLGFEEIRGSIVDPLGGPFGTFDPNSLQDSELRNILGQNLDKGRYLPLLIGLKETDVNKQMGIAALFTMCGAHEKHMLITMNLPELYAQSKGCSDPELPEDGMTHFLFPLMFVRKGSGYLPVTLFDDKAINVTFLRPAGGENG